MGSMITDEKIVFTAGLVLFVFVAGNTLPRLAHAAEWYLNSDVQQEISYDDNIGLNGSSDQKISEFGETSSIRFKMGGRSPSTVIELASLFDFTRFPNERSLNSNDQYLTLSAFTSGERYRVGVVGDVTRDTTRTSDVEETGAFILQNRRREVLGAGPEFVYQLTPLDEISVSGRYNDTHYPSNNLRDFRSWGGSGLWAHRLDERTRLLINGSGSKTDSGSAGSLNSEFYSAQTGFEYLFSETLNGRVTAGPTLVDNNQRFVFDEQTITESSVDLGYGFDLSIDYYYQEDLKFFGNIFRTVRPNNTSGVIVEETGVRFGSTYRLTPRIYFDGTGLYTFRETLGSETRLNERHFVSFRPALRWEFLEDWTLGISYRLRWQQRDGSDDGDAYSNSVFASLSYKLPPLSASR